MKTIEKSTSTKIVAIIVFYVIAVLLRYLSSKTNLMEYIDHSFLKITLQGIGPAIGAWIALKAFGLKSSYSLAGQLKPLLFSVLIFVCLPMAGFALIGLAGNEGIVTSSTLLLVGAKLTFYFIIYATLEEVGWRVFLHDQLDFMNQYLKIVTVGILWFLWHLDFEISTTNFIFLVTLIIISWIIGKVGDRTKSLLAVGACHVAYNLFDSNRFDYNEKIIVLAICALIWILYMAFHEKLTRYLPFYKAQPGGKTS